MSKRNQPKKFTSILKKASICLRKVRHFTTPTCAPDEYNLIEEVNAFIDKERKGIAELHEVTELQKEAIDKQRADIANTLDDLKTKP